MVLGNSLRAVCRSKLPQQVLDVRFDGPVGHEQTNRDLRVSLSLSDATQDIPFAAGHRLRDATATFSRRLAPGRRSRHRRLETLTKDALHHRNRDVIDERIDAARVLTTRDLHRL